MKANETPRRIPDFGRLVTTLFRGEADAVPLIELGVHPLIKEALLGRPIRTVADDIAFMESMGYDFIKIQPVFSFPLNLTIVPSTSTPGTYTNTPDRAWASEHRGLITNWKEYEQYPWPSPADIDYSRFEEARRVLPEGMGVIGQYGDIFTVAWELMGFETFAMAMHDEPELVNAVFDRVAALVLSMYDTMADMEWVGALWFSDDIAYGSGLMVRPDFLRRKFFPSLRHIGTLAKRRGIPFLYHTDGVLWSVLDDIIAAGVDALHPVEPGSMDIVDVKRRHGKQLALCGGIDLDLLVRGTPDQVSSLVMQLVDTVAPGGGWCAGSSNSIPEYVPVANYRTMVETLLAYGRYR
jgi:uroporphyrinogen decarboxylase